ncbi:mannose-6-phosphate isomerase, class I [Kitasatospora sp. NPDC001603]|uniref:mannose-6-phosphate isomerase, class I n=1 Tax=Kitasatospora sp. NPDC001603 TaxID=3154388 RepID=UPI00332B6D83
MDRLTGTLHTYSWGSPTLIPHLQGRLPDGRPHAELWLGAHSAAPSHLEGDQQRLALDRVIAGDPTGELGADTVARFGPRLPFLLKLIAAERPLSLQTHPTTVQAQAGFAREEAAGIPRDAPHRTYKDPHHKPELICALTDFEALCGFKPPGEAHRLITNLHLPALQPLAEALRQPQDALRTAFTCALGWPRAELHRLTGDLATALDRMAADEHAPLSAQELHAHAALARSHPSDPGVLAALLLHHVLLRPGEGLYLGPGIPHTYLRGLGVEIMAASDNVVRCGLTSKHVDIPELLNTVAFTPYRPYSLSPTAAHYGGEEAYAAAVADFRLSRYVFRGEARSHRLRPGTAQILLCTHGQADVTAPGRPTTTLSAGQAVFLPARSAGVRLSATQALVWRATTGMPPIGR